MDRLRGLPPSAQRSVLHPRHAEQARQLTRSLRPLFEPPQHGKDRALTTRPEASMTTDRRADEGFQRLLQRASRGDAEAEAAVIILNQCWARPKAHPFVDADGIDFAGMLSAHSSHDAANGVCETWRGPVGCDCGPYWSSGEALLIRLSWNLWSGDERSAVDVARLLDICDDNSLALALAAIQARRCDPLPVIDTPRQSTSGRGTRTAPDERSARETWPRGSSSTPGNASQCHANPRRSL